MATAKDEEQPCAVSPDRRYLGYTIATFIAMLLGSTLRRMSLVCWMTAMCVFLFCLFVCAIDCVQLE
jgi:hypothetical protein